MTATNLKILIPVTSFGRAGGMRVLSQLASYWNNLGNNVSFVSFYESESPYFPVDVEVIWIDNNGNQVKNNITTYKSEKSGLKRIYSLYKYLKRHSHEYDIVLANSNKSTWPVWFGSKAKNFYYIQAYEVEFSSSKSLKSLLKRVSASLTYYLPLIKVVNAELYKNYKNIKSRYVVPPGLDLNVYHPKKLNNNLKEKDFTIGCIGRKAEWKGSNDVGEAVKILRSQGYKVKFKVAFEPVDYLDHELVKPDGDNNLADFYRSLDVLVAPGHIQLGAIHYPVIEAMACKTPVITTGYYPANNYNAYIVPIRRPDVIANTIIEMLKNYDLAIEKTEIAYKGIFQFDWKVVSSKFIDIFNNEL